MNSIDTTDILASDDEANIKHLLRTMGPSDLRAIVHRDGFIRSDEANLLRPENLTISDTALRLTEQVVDLRSEGVRLCRGTLAGLGHEFHGTGGWHILAMVTTDGTVGFVNIARGIAIQTDVQVEADIAEALTIPDQGSGPQASGAVAWAAGDVGEAKRATSPDGWVQLLVDLRGGEEPITSRAAVVAWGLMTCYDTLGMPGPAELDGGDYFWTKHDGLLPVADWPDSGDLTTMRRIAQEALEEIVARLAVHVPEVVDLDHRSAMTWLRSQPRPRGYSVERAAEYVTSDFAPYLRTTVQVPDRLRTINRLVAVAQDPADVFLDSARLLYDLVSFITAQRLAPVGDHLTQFLDPLVDEQEGPTADYRILTEQLTALAPELIDHLLAPSAERARTATHAALEAYVGNGPVPVDIPLRSREV